MDLWKQRIHLPGLIIVLHCLATGAWALDDPPVADRLSAIDEAADAYRAHCLAVLQGDAEAAYHLGWLYFNQGTSDEIAVGWFRLAAERGDVHSQRILRDLLPNTPPAEDPGCPLRDSEPTRTTIETWIQLLAPGYGLDADLLMALVEVESRFDPKALSPRNAHGLMQLLPRTAKRFDVENIWDPVDNLRGGMAYLSWLMELYDGDINLSLAAYNAGEHIVERYGGIPPYAETRNYVKTINRLYAQTRAAFVEPAPASSL